MKGNVIQQQQTSTFDSTATFNGDVVLGNSSSDNITFNGDTVGNLTPNVSDTNDIGTSAQKYRNGYFSNLLDIGGNITVGGAATLNGDVVLGNSSTDDITFNGDTVGNLTPNVNNTYDLGSPAQKYRDLYLGGGAYLGGTSVTNKLDIYEEGTFTPQVYVGGVAGTISSGSNIGRYTRIGNTVTIMMRCVMVSYTGSGNVTMDGLPYIVNSASTFAYVELPVVNGYPSSGYVHGRGYLAPGGYGFATLQGYTTSGGVATLTNTGLTTTLDIRSIFTYLTN